MSCKPLCRTEANRRAASLSRTACIVGGNLIGVVHEVRNPLSAIKGAAVEILEDELAPDIPPREFAHIAKTEVESIDKLVEEFFHFARPSKLAKTYVNVLFNGINFA